MECPWSIPEWGGINSTTAQKRLYFEVIKKGVQIESVDLDFLNHGSSFFSIGRSPSCDIILDHPSISRYHAVVQSRKKDNCLFLVDLNSTQGTFVNKAQLPPNSPRKLEHGDIVQFGQSSRIYILSHERHEVTSEDEASPQDDSVDTFIEDEDTIFDRTHRQPSFRDKSMPSEEVIFRLLEAIKEEESTLSSLQQELPSFESEDPLELQSAKEADIASTREKLVGLWQNLRDAEKKAMENKQQL